MNNEKKKILSVVKKPNYFSKLKDGKLKKSFVFFKTLISAQLETMKKKELKNKNFDKTINPSIILTRESSKKAFSKEQLKILESYGKIEYDQDIERNLDLMVYAIKKFKTSHDFIKINNISDKSLMLFCAIGKIFQYPKGSCIYLRHHESKEFFLIIKGKVSIRSLEPEKIIEINDKEKINENNLNISISFERSKSSYTDRIIDQEKFSNKSFNIYNNFPKNESEENENSQNFDRQILKSITQKTKKRQKSLPIKNIKNESNKNNRHSFNDINDINNNINEINNNFIKFNNVKMSDIYLLYKNLSYNINTYCEGNFFGEWDLINNRDRLNSVFAEENTTVLVLYKEYFKKYFQTSIMNSDYAKKLFIRRHIPCLNVDYIPFIIPELHNKNEIIYTEHDYAKEFFIIYKGSGVLKKLNSAKSKKDIFLNKNKMKNLLLLDKGSIIGVECSLNKKFYENTFMISENNTFIFRINLKEFQLNKETKLKLKKFLCNLYIKQKKLIQDYVLNNADEEEKNINSNNKEDEIINSIIFSGNVDSNIKTLYNVECVPKPMKLIINKLDSKVKNLIKSNKINEKIIPKLLLNNIESYESKKNINNTKHFKFNSMPETSDRDFSSHRMVKKSILSQKNTNLNNYKTNIKLTKRNNTSFKFFRIDKYLKDTIQTSRSRNNNIYYNSGLFNIPFLTMSYKGLYSKRDNRCISK